ncbi:MAG: hypothetical protein S4CHLAM6_03950 [Chlamydiae bacterium]|nr:hypothetical protein [Chlamydiota bacterium]
MQLTRLKTAFFLIILCSTSYSYCNDINIKECISSTSQQERFHLNLLEGIIDSLCKLNLSKNETQLLKDHFNSHINEVFGSLDCAEKLFDSNPQTFEIKYLDLFVRVKKEIITNRNTLDIG